MHSHTYLLHGSNLVGDNNNRVCKLPHGVHEFGLLLYPSLKRGTHDYRDTPLCFLLHSPSNGYPLLIGELETDRQTDRQTDKQTVNQGEEIVQEGGREVKFVSHLEHFTGETDREDASDARSDEPFCED